MMMLSRFIAGFEPIPIVKSLQTHSTLYASPKNP